MLHVQNSISFQLTNMFFKNICIKTIQCFFVHKLCKVCTYSTRGAYVFDLCLVLGHANTMWLRTVVQFKGHV